nr:NAD-dependent epimerase/dehydratase family protein [Sphingomonas japonica]
MAITGGTGFVGSAVLRLAVEAGHRVRALTRRAQPAQEGVEWLAGTLEDAPALARLAGGADAVVHIAGVVNAPTRDGFLRGNIDGTRAMLAAARSAGVARFVHVSSLSAREPQLSHYGWSKAQGDLLVEQSGLDWTIVRPPAIYGPGDHDMLELFRMAQKGVVALPPPGRFSIVHVEDLARLLIALAQATGDHSMYEADDGTPGGWTHVDFARALGRAVGQRVLPLSLPRAILALGARLDRMARGDKARLTPDRVGYLAHPDWAIDPAHRPPPSLWTPQVGTPQGLAATAMWYRAHGLL